MTTPQQQPLFDFGVPAEPAGDAHAVHGHVQGPLPGPTPAPLRCEKLGGWTGLAKAIAALCDPQVIRARLSIRRLLRLTFTAQSRFDTTASLWEWLLIGAGVCSWVPGHKGGILPLARPLPLWANRSQLLELQARLERLVFETPSTARTLWPSSTPQECERLLLGLAIRIKPVVSKLAAHRFAEDTFVKSH